LNKHSYSQSSHHEPQYISRNIKKRNYDYDEEEIQEEDYPRHYHKKQIINRKIVQPRKSKDNYYYEINPIEEKSNLEKPKLNKTKSSKKIYPLFRKIKTIDSNTFEKDNKEGKYQFLHQKLFTENIKNKNKEISPDSFDSSFDTTTNTTDIALHLTLYNIQKYR